MLMEIFIIFLQTNFVILLYLHALFGENIVWILFFCFRKELGLDGQYVDLGRVI